MHDWLGSSQRWAYAHGGPIGKGLIKVRPQDFAVTELLARPDSDQGEHAWLWVEKTRANSDEIARQLASFAKVKPKDVGYAGRKDYFAVTRQWFSVWLPGKPDPDWTQINSDRLTVLDAVRHQRKLNTGANRGNHFCILVRDIEGLKDQLRKRVNAVKHYGVPNYFGLQRFGNEFSNLHNAVKLAHNKFPVKSRRTRGLVLSAARSFLFNECLSKRIGQGDWASLSVGEPAVLAGSNAFFISELASAQDPELAKRLEQGDIHPSSVLYGVDAASGNKTRKMILPQEQQVCDSHKDLSQVVCDAGLKLERRATRSLPENLNVEISEGSAQLRFSLPKGQYATSVLRELVIANGV